MSKHAPAAPSARKHNVRTLAAASFGVGALAITGAGIYAGLTADAFNTSAEAVSSGTLKLTMAASTGAASISTAVSNLAPGDIDNRFVTLTNSGSLVGKNLGLSVADGTGSVLSTGSAGTGLAVSVSNCSVAYVATTGVCAGTETTYLAKTALSALTTRNVFTGPINPAAGTAYNLKVSLYLDGTETVSNGTLPAGTMQGLSGTLTYTFSEDQRTAVTTNS